jgi:peptidoglycan/LPS O-acetylase OafA/YrhL
VFERNPLTEVNGALWTLKIEVLFYAAVPALVLLVRRYGWLAVLGTTYVGSLIYVEVCDQLFASTGHPIYQILARQLPGQLSYFIAGAAIYYRREPFEMRLGAVAAISLTVLVINRVVPLSILEPAALGAVVMAAAFGRYLGPAGRFGDFSYGLYILHFPVVQVLVQAGWFQGRPFALMVTALGSALAGAFLLWHLVEKRWLLPGNHYRRAER